MMTGYYQQLTYEQRCQICVLNKRGDSQRQIALLVGVNQSTISRELKRNAGQRGYRPKQAENKRKNRRADASKPTKMTEPLIELIESKIRLEWSPQQISGWLKLEEDIDISHESIYLHIWENKRQGGDLHTFLRRQGKKYDKRRHNKSSRGQIPNRVGIEHRPIIVDAKVRVGDWEIDTVIGKNHSGALVTIVERVTRLTLSAQVENRTAEAVAEATIRLLKPYKGQVHTITADNGKEFSQHEKISEALSSQFYFANPYSSWERGLNENTNGLLRQYFPKNVDLKTVTQQAVDEAVSKLNSRPRECLMFKTPEQMMQACA